MEEDHAQWEYIDGEGAQQGPYSEEEFQSWCEAGYFASTNLIRPANDATQPFLPIAAFRPRFAESVLTPLPPRNPELDSNWVILDAKCDANGPFSTAVIRGFILRGDFDDENEGPDTVLISMLREGGDEHLVRFRHLEEFDEFEQARKFREIDFDAVWYFQDDTATIMGPFSAASMVEFVDTGEFVEETLIFKSDAPTVDAAGPIHLKIEDFYQIGELETAADRLFLTEVSDSKQCFTVDETGQIIGPFELESFLQFAKESLISSNSLVCVMGDKVFKNLEKHALLQQMLKDSEDNVVERTLREAEEQEENEPPTVWFYIDDEGKTQGPFPSKDMSSWIHAGYLKKDRKVSMNSAEGPFSHLVEMMKLINEKATSERLKKIDRTTKSSHNSEPKRWMYLNCELQEHGPFTDSQMKYFAITGVISKEFKFKRTDITIEMMKSDNSLRMLKNWMPVAPSLANLFPFYRAMQDQWEYLDKEGIKQGPFPTTMMREWFVQGYFDGSIRVKTVKEAEFRELASRPRPSFTSVQLKMSVLPSQGVPLLDPSAFTANATFNKNTGRFEASGNVGTRWTRVGLPNDTSGRQMAQYFNVDSWNEVQPDDVQETQS